MRAVKHQVLRNFIPTGIRYDNIGDYEVAVTVFNGCGMASQTATFSILEPMQALAALDTTFGCTPFELGVMNLSTGDRLNYLWEVEDGIVSDANTANPTFNFSEVGQYVVKLTVSNEVCGADTWTDTVMISEAPEVVLTQIPDFCSGAELDFSDLVSYPNQSLVDSVRWTFEGSQTPSSMEFIPMGIVYDSTGVFEVTVTVFNGCGMASQTAMFSILEPMQALAVLDTTLVVSLLSWA